MSKVTKDINPPMRSLTAILKDVKTEIVPDENSKKERIVTTIISKETGKKNATGLAKSKINITSSTNLNNNAFTNKQLNLFQNFFSTAGNEKSETNSIELWDNIPKYHVSQQAMNKMREKNGNGQLNILEVEYKFKDKPMKATIHPALIRVKSKDGVTETKGFYPSANEELVEEALRKIASVQYNGFHENNQRSGVVFTLNQLREELKQSGHARTCAQIVTSLNILSLSIIEVSGIDSKKQKSFARSPYFPLIAAVTRDSYNEDPHAKWLVQFHPLVTHAIDTLAYRQLDYDTLMTFKTQLGRWLHRWLTNKFTQASRLESFQIYYKTIKVQSKLLDNYQVERLAIKEVHETMQELVDLDIASNVLRSMKYGAFNKIIDVQYTIYPSDKFIKQTKAANARHKEHLKEITLASK